MINSPKPKFGEIRIPSLNAFCRLFLSSFLLPAMHSIQVLSNSHTNLPDIAPKGNLRSSDTEQFLIKI